MKILVSFHFMCSHGHSLLEGITQRTVARIMPPNEQDDDSAPGGGVDFGGCTEQELSSDSCSVQRTGLGTSTIETETEAGSVASGNGFTSDHPAPCSGIVGASTALAASAPDRDHHATCEQTLHVSENRSSNAEGKKEEEEKEEETAPAPEREPAIEMIQNFASTYQEEEAEEAEAEAAAAAAAAAAAESASVIIENEKSAEVTTCTSIITADIAARLPPVDQDEDGAICTACDGGAALTEADNPPALGFTPLPADNSDIRSSTRCHERESIRNSIRSTPGAFRVYLGNSQDNGNVQPYQDPVRRTASGGTQRSNDTLESWVAADIGSAISRRDSLEQSRARASARRSSSIDSGFEPSRDRRTPSEPELTEAWLVDEDDIASSSSGGCGAVTNVPESTDSPIVTVTATPMKTHRSNRRKTLWIVVGAGCIIIGTAVAIAVKKSPVTVTEVTRPFEIEVPTMPQSVSDMLSVKYNKLIGGKPIAMAFSSDLTVHSSTLVDGFYGLLEVVKYDATSGSWTLISKYDTNMEKNPEDKHILRKEGNPINSMGDSFGAWVDMSYDGSILAVGLPRDDDTGLPDAGSVMLMDILEDGGNDDEGGPQMLTLDGRGDWISGTEQYSWSGTTFSLSADGSIIAIAAPLASVLRGSARVYRYEGNGTRGDARNWVPMGQEIFGDESGASLSLAKLTADGTMLATGAVQGKTKQNQGQVRMFSWDATTNLWVQKGSSIQGQEGDRLGLFPHLSRDGLTVSFSQLTAPRKCLVYQWDESASDWNRIGIDNSDSYICMDLSPDGKKVIMCSVDKYICSIQEYIQEEWIELQTFDIKYGFVPYVFERDGDGDKVAGIVAPIGNEEDAYTIGYYNLS